MEKKIYNQQGKENGTVTLTDSVFDMNWNGDLVHQVMSVMQSNARILRGVTKDRSEVSGGGKKPWRQKGTGRARHGSNRSPIWIGGGVTHGPRREQNFKRKINRKMKNKALLTAFSAKLRDNEVLFVDSLKIENPQTKDARTMIDAWGKALSLEKSPLEKKKNSMKVVVFENETNVQKSFRNFDNVDVISLQNMNVLDVLTHKYMVIVGPEDSVSFLENKTV